MSKKKQNKSKDVYGSQIRRSEYDDGLLRDNHRAGNRLKTEMHYYERAQRVIMKDLGKESSLLQNKIDKDNTKTLNLGLYGSKFGTTAQGSRKYSSTSPMGKILTSTAFKPTMRKTGTSRQDTRFPWDRDAERERDSSLERGSALSLSMSMSRNKYRTPTASAYPSARAQSDDFLANILNEAMNDELLYTQSPEMKSPNKQEMPKTPRSRRTSKTSHSKAMTTPTGSLVNALSNAQETEEVIY